MWRAFLSVLCLAGWLTAGLFGLALWPGTAGKAAFSAIETGEPVSPADLDIALAAYHDVKAVAPCLPGAARDAVDLTLARLRNAFAASDGAVPHEAFATASVATLDALACQPLNPALWNTLARIRFSRGDSGGGSEALAISQTAAPYEAWAIVARLSIALPLADRLLPPARIAVREDMEKLLTVRDDIKNPLFAQFGVERTAELQRLFVDTGLHLQTPRI